MTSALGRVEVYFIYGELAELYRKIGETEKDKEYAELFERCERRQA